MKDSLPKLHTGDIQVTVRGNQRPVHRIVERSRYTTPAGLVSVAPPERALLPTTPRKVVRRARRAGITVHRRKRGYGASPSVRVSEALSRVRASRSGASSEREPMPWQKKLAAQSAVCAALLLAIWGLAQWDAPVAQQATEAVRAAVSTNVDIDQALGKLKFVSNLLPDAAFVFAPMTEDTPQADPAPSLILPCSGRVTQAYDTTHTGIVMRGAKEAVAPGSGEVVGVSQDAGEWSVRMRHDGGVETVTACLKRILVSEGDSLRAGDVIGEASSFDGEAKVYFEVLLGGLPVDPQPYLAAK